MASVYVVNKQEGENNTQDPTKKLELCENDLIKDEKREEHGDKKSDTTKLLFAQRKNRGIWRN